VKYTGKIYSEINIELEEGGKGSVTYDIVDERKLKLNKD